MSDPVHDTPPAVTPDDFPAKPFKLERRPGANLLAPDDPPPVAEAPAKPKRGRPKKPAAGDGAIVHTPATASTTAPAAGSRRYRVNLNCPTPLRDPTLVVEAFTEDEAKAKFERHNGICGSVHPYTVTEV